VLRSAMEIGLHANISVGTDIFGAPLRFTDVFVY